MIKKRQQVAGSNFALLRLSVIMIVIGALVMANVLFVTAFGYHIRSGTNVAAYSEIATTSETIYARRGYIFDRNGNILAQDSVSYNMVATLDSSRPSYEGYPAYVPEDKKEEYAQKIAAILGCESDVILGYLQQDLYQTEFGAIGRGLSSSTKEAIEELGLFGIEFEEQSARNYPLGNFASHLIGYTRYNVDDDVLIGEMGIESLLNDYLVGKNGSKVFSQDANGYSLLGTQISYTAAVNGNNVYLTLDKGCQEALELAMQQTAKQFNASKVWGGVMDVKTGKMLAWGSYPGFDPNTMDITNYLDLGADLAYEPGSTMKTFTYAAAIDSGLYNGSDTLYSGPYYVNYSSSGKLKRSNKDKGYGTIRNFRNANLGYVSYDQAYFRSLNVGIASLLTDVISPSVLEDYLERFGFFQNVNTDGVNDVAGTKNMNTGLDMIATGYGQSSSVTALQMFQAYGAIFNGGTMVKPYFIDYIEDPYTNEILYQGKTEVVGQPISEATSKKVIELMKQVVTDKEYGTAKWYRLDGMSIAVKTGTGEVFEHGSYGNQVIASVACGLPADDPQVFIYFAYQANYSPNMHYKTGPIKRFFNKIIKELSISDSTSSQPETPQEAETPQEEETDEKAALTHMPSLLNHSLSYATERLKGSGTKVIVLGNGDTVIRQFPQADTELVRKQKVFLLTSLQKIKMPDMTGWSRKDVNAFWELTGIGVDMEGYGYVVSQSIPKGTTLELTDTIQLVLSNER